MRSEFRMTDFFFQVVVCLAGLLWSTQPQGKVAAQELAADAEPYLRVEAEGPQSYVTALDFGPRGETLHAAGWDKVIYTWRRDAGSGAYQFQPEQTYRLPIGPGLLGAINSIAISRDGRWIAAAGHGVFRGAALFRQTGRVFPSEGVLTNEMRQDEGEIFVFDTRDDTVRRLRGHAGSVVALAFAGSSSADQEREPALVSLAREWSNVVRPARYVGRAVVWSLDGQELATRDLPEPTTRPGLAAVQTGTDPNDLQVVFSLGDERHRLWDVAADGWDEIPCGRYGNGAAYSELTKSFVTAVLDRHGGDHRGQLELRNPLDVATPMALESSFPGTYIVPRALDVAGDGERELVAVVSRVLGNQNPQQPTRFLLHAVSLSDSGFGPLSGGMPLWVVPSTSAVPSVAVSPAGDVIAVAGNLDHSIWLFRTDRMKPDARPAQVLTNIGLSWNQVSFARNGDRQALALRGATSNLHFDLTAGRRVDEEVRWLDDTSAAAGWRLDVSRRNNVTGATVLQGGKEFSRLALPEGEIVSAHAFLVPATSGQGGLPPLIAVASHRLGQPTLRLYNARTGSPFRQLTGHTQIIHSLAFDAAGRFLASIAGDQTVCLWKLADLDTILGQHGMLPGVAAAEDGDQEDRQVSVAAIRASASAEVRRALKTGDVLRGWKLGNEQRFWKNRREFLDAFWSLRPGTKVTLLGTRQGKDFEAPVAAGQGIDERKPLLNFFFSAARSGEETAWIAWSPLGPYDASGRDVERHLGWHFNTGEPAQPTRFAPADEYRKTYYREGLVRELTATGELAQKLSDPPSAISLRFEPEVEQRWQDDVGSPGTELEFAL